MYSSQKKPLRSPVRLLLRRLGPLRVVRTATSCAKSVNHFGKQRSSPNAQRLDVPGSQLSQLMPSWVVDVCRRRRPSTHKNYAVSSTRRSPVSATPQPTFHHRASCLRRLAATSRRSASSPSTTSPPSSVSYLTSNAPPTHFQRAF